MKSKHLKTKFSFSSILLFALIGCGQSGIETGEYSTKGDGYCACESREDLERFVQFSVEKDYEAMSELLVTNKCVKITGGVKVFVQSSSVSGIVKIRPKGVSESSWTVVEALTKN